MSGGGFNFAAAEIVLVIVNRYQIKPDNLVGKQPGQSVAPSDPDSVDRTKADILKSSYSNIIHQVVT